MSEQPLCDECQRPLRIVPSSEQSLAGGEKDLVCPVHGLKGEEYRRRA